MKLVFTLALLIISTLSVHAQRFNWATTGGYQGIANSFNGAVDIATDPDGNVYTMDSGNGTQECQGQSFEELDNTTAFIYKFNSYGELLHVSRIGAVGGDFYPYNIECDEEGSIYVVGQANGITEIMINDTIVSAVGNTNQLVKLNSAGEFQWKINTGFAGNGEGCMLQYHNGHVYYQAGNLKIKKVNQLGEVGDLQLEADYYSSPTSSMGPIFKGSGVFSNGDLMFAAYSRGTIAYGTDTLFHIDNPFLTAPFMFIRCSEDMQLIWAKYVSNGRDPDNNFLPVAIDSGDNVYAAVQVNDTLTIGSDLISNPLGTFIGVGSLIKMDGDGNGLWGHPLDNTLSAFGWCLISSPDGNGIYIGGGFTGTATFGDFTFGPAIGNLPFIARIDGDGNYINAFNYLTQSYQTDARCFGRTVEGKYFVGGKMQAQVNPIFSCTEIEAFPGFYLGNFTEQPDFVPQPILTMSDNVLTASPPFEGEIEWMLNGNVISGENGQSLIVTQSGNYSVSYEYGTGCIGSDTSDVFVAEVIGVPDFHNEGLSLKPNPSNGVFSLCSEYSQESNYQMEMRNTLGELVFESNIVTPGSSIDVHSLPAGVYLVQLKQQNKMLKTLRMVKQ